MFQVHLSRRLLSPCLSQIFPMKVVVKIPNFGLNMTIKNVEKNALGTSDENLEIKVSKFVIPLPLSVKSLTSHRVRATPSVTMVTLVPAVTRPLTRPEARITRPSSRRLLGYLCRARYCWPSSTSRRLATRISPHGRTWNPFSRTPRWRRWGLTNTSPSSRRTSSHRVNSLCSQTSPLYRLVGASRSWRHQCH